MNRCQTLHFARKSGALETVQSYSFPVDRDIEKIITVTRTDQYIDVKVRFAADVVLDETHDRLSVRGPVEVVTDRHGLTVIYSPGDRTNGTKVRRRY